MQPHNAMHMCVRSRFCSCSQAPHAHSNPVALPLLALAQIRLEESLTVVHLYNALGGGWR
jgi:hypothetical protein